MYRDRKRLANKRAYGKAYSEFYEKYFENEVATLIAILVVNDRKREADEIAESAREELSDAAFIASLEKALKREFPAPWPE